MELIIRKYVTAVDEKDPTKGNKTMYSVEKRVGEDAENYPNLGEFDLVEFIIKELK